MKKNFYNEVSVYDDQQLQNSIAGLEDRFNVVENSTLSNLVNFSQNNGLPFHQWFIYREGFSKALIEHLIDDSGCKTDEIVLDPFCGSGTTNLVAALRGLQTIGIDVNPMSSVLTQAKITAYSKQDIREAKRLLEKIELDNINIIIDDSLERYFDRNNLISLVKIKSYIDSIEDGNSKQILFVAYISIIIECSNRKRDGNGLKTRPTKVANVLDYFIKRANLIIKDIDENPIESNGISMAYQGSALSIGSIVSKMNEIAKIGTIIFSPPYPNSFDYFESYKLELILGGFVPGIKNISEFRQQAVRSFITSKKSEESIDLVEMIANEIEYRIPQKEHKTGKRDSRTRKVPSMLRGYFNDMKEVLHQCYSVIEPGRKVYIVVDQSAYLGIIVPSDLLLALIGEQCGFKTENIVICRKARTSTQQLLQYPYLKNCLRESIVILKKPESFD